MMLFFFPAMKADEPARNNNTDDFENYLTIFDNNDDGCYCDNNDDNVDVCNDNEHILALGKKLGEEGAMLKLGVILPQVFLHV